MEIQKTSVKQRNQIHLPFTQVNAGVVQANSRASVQYHVWSGVVLTFPHFMHDSMFAHRSAHNPWAMLFLSAAALVANVWVFAAHVRTIVSKRRNPLTQEVHADEATYASWVRDLASEEDKELIAAHLGTTPEKAGFTSASEG